MKKATLTLWIAFGLFCAVALHANSIVRYAFSAGDTYTATPQAATESARGVTASPMTAWMDARQLTGEKMAAMDMGFYRTWAFMGRNAYGAGFGDDYFEFTLSVEAGKAILFDSVSFSYRAPQAKNGGTFFWDVRSSADQFASSLALVQTSQPNTDSDTGDLDIAKLGEIGGSITFRIYQYEAATGQVTGGGSRLVNFVLNGRVKAAGAGSTILAPIRSGLQSSAPLGSVPAVIEPSGGSQTAKPATPKKPAAPKNRSEEGVTPSAPEQKAPQDAAPVAPKERPVIPTQRPANGIPSTGALQSAAPKGGTVPFVFNGAAATAAPKPVRAATAGAKTEKIAQSGLKANAVAQAGQKSGSAMAAPKASRAAMAGAKMEKMRSPA